MDPLDDEAEEPVDSTMLPVTNEESDVEIDTDPPAWLPPAPAVMTTDPPVDVPPPAAIETRPPEEPLPD